MNGLPQRPPQPSPTLYLLVSGGEVSVLICIQPFDTESYIIKPLQSPLTPLAPTQRRTTERVAGATWIPMMGSR